MQLTSFVSLIVNCFQANLVCILQYGSSKTSTHPADVDVLVVLRHKRDTSADLRSLKAVIQQFPKIYFDAQIVYLEEFANHDNFSHDSFGCFFMIVFQHAEVLWGKNPFLGITLDRGEVVRSIVRKLQYYVFRARQIFLGEAFRSKDKNGDFHRKKLLMAMLSILLCEDNRLSSKPLDDFVERFPGCLAGTDVAIIRQQDTEPMSIELALPIYEKLYSLALRIEAEFGRAV